MKSSTSRLQQGKKRKYVTSESTLKFEKVLGKLKNSRKTKSFCMEFTELPTEQPLSDQNISKNWKGKTFFQ